MSNYQYWSNFFNIDGKNRCKNAHKESSFLFITYTDVIPGIMLTHAANLDCTRPLKQYRTIYYRPQTKFGVRSCFTRECHSVLGGGLPTGGGGVLHRGGGVLHPGGSAYRRGSAYTGVCPRGEGGYWADPPELEKRAVRILLECFLVLIKMSFSFFCQPL